jgi:hypothetical protein
VYQLLSHSALNVQHFLCSPETRNNRSCFTFIAENVVLLAQYKHPRDASLSLFLVNFSGETETGRVLACMALPGEIPDSGPQIQVFGSALPRPKSPFGSREVRISWATRSPSGTFRIGILVHPSVLLSAVPQRHPLTAPPNIAWSEWGQATRLVPDFDVVYGGVRPSNPRRLAYLELEHPPASTQCRTEPSVLGERLRVDQVRVIEFGRIGPSAPTKVVAKAILSIFRDQILGQPVVPLAYILERNRAPQDLRLFEYVAHCDEERIVILDVSTIIFLPVVLFSRLT